MIFISDYDLNFEPWPFELSKENITAANFPFQQLPKISFELEKSLPRPSLWSFNNSIRPYKHHRFPVATWKKRETSWLRYSTGDGGWCWWWWLVIFLVLVCLKKNIRLKPCSSVFSGGSLAGEISNELKVGTEDCGRMMSSNSFNVMIVLNVYHLETHQINLQTSHFRMMWFGGAPCWRRYWWC